ncbi:MAG: radical SAM protein [Candidatus Scalindua sp. AMX11]|nr:MAG: radical SAM protein [Candidatus Scalindua sp.]NOG83413.1 radical SAM protein [Planctomycetota bacterium]RZV75074.1 MAG: radical SAM protein [Candidatus Scalindua sp. SCAELEC01]TDE64336.1 MAG: radical SAM protein [Candidatus Scalindua sp. AMX11]GJQ60605.1 MAG: hypothetical protein SCALA701_34060 [Candidatus Scalindua sp.]
MSIVLLEHPRPKNHKRFADVVNTPLSSCLMTGYIASVLKTNDINTEVVDANLLGWSFSKTIQELKTRKFRLLGVHLVYLWEKTEEVFEMLADLRKEGVHAHINLFGHFPTFAYRDILLNYPFVDSITVGEPEVTIQELSKAIITCQGKPDLRTIDGLAFHTYSSGSKNGKAMTGHHLINIHRNDLPQKAETVKTNPRSVVSNLDTLPSPFRYNFEIVKKRGIATYILGSRGCYGICTFCYLDRFYGDDSTWRGRSPENVFEEIVGIYRDFGETYFYFADANFFGPGRKGKERAATFARLMIDKGLQIRFGIECRVNDIEAQSLNLLVEAGLKNVFLGVESGSQKSLNRLKKQTTVEENKRAIRMLRHHKIEPNYGFIMFEPDSTLCDVRENFEFLKEMEMLRKPSITAHLLYHQQAIFKGMADYETRKEDAESVSKFHYEYRYHLRDENVALLAERVNGFCLDILNRLSGERFGEKGTLSCDYDEEDSISKELNQELINYFEKSLSSLENNKSYDRLR